MATIKIEMNNQEVLTLAASIATCCLVGLEQHLPPHAAIARRVREVEKGIMSLASLSGMQLTDEMLDIGTGAWGQAMRYVSRRVKDQKGGVSGRLPRKP